MDATAQYVTDPRADPGPDETLTLAHELVRQLVEATGKPTGSSEVLLDCTIDGVHYRLIGSPCPAPQNGRRSVPGVRGLSPRELEIARMVSLGHTTKTIADVLDISLWTVSTHLRRVFAKLGVSTRAAMIGVLSGDPELAAVTADTPPGRV
ncbi:helix-turn-helix domain-containing protein [Rugosimonospora africana]|uniref:HTH luxR-type domain-containing protein n=1 Tax=Rugosimonospora africana TaxID=556532 RepID=A0A8J3QUE8_9ACTN|nr:helix-turn-helix transcriptional regulator [Rugosimonospora africana]GIH15908.1 hypothetical protein Raf01_40800 [Rugosimonospora africana]